MNGKMLVKGITIAACVLCGIGLLCFFTPALGWEFSVGFFVAGVIIEIPTIFLFFPKGLTRLPEHKINATVTNKYITESTGFAGNGITFILTQYNVTFLTENNDNWTFILSSADMYNLILPYDKGVLIYKENEKHKIYFEGFIRLH